MCAWYLRTKKKKYKKAPVQTSKQQLSQKLSNRLDGSKTNDAKFVLFLPDITNNSGAAILGRLNDSVQIFDAERDVFDTVAVFHQVRAHFRIIVRFVNRFEDETNLNRDTFNSFVKKESQNQM